MHGLFYLHAGASVRLHDSPAWGTSFVASTFNTPESIVMIIMLVETVVNGIEYLDKRISCLQDVPVIGCLRS